MVLHNGDSVTAFGSVVSLPGRAVRFCSPYVPVATDGSTEQAAPSYCEFGIDVTGVDLNKLTNRREQDGAIEGTAELTGAYRDGALTVTAQQAPPQEQTPTRWDRPPCDPPTGGWPVGGVDESGNLDDEPASVYMRSHPGAVVMLAVLRPSAHQALMYVLTAGDPAPVQAALRPAYGQRLCVIRSKYTRAEVDAAHATLVWAMGQDAAGQAGVYDAGGTGLGPDEQVQVSAAMVQVTPELARIATAQPAGLVLLEPWLRPS